jgi:hypothetical protein
MVVPLLTVGCRCRLSVNTICGRIMNGLSLLSTVSKHKMWSYYDLVYCNPSVNTILNGRSITDGRKQRQPNHNTITYCVYWRITINQIIIRPHLVFTDGRQQRVVLWLGCRCCRPSETQYVVVLWLGCRCYLQSVNTICGGIMIGLSYNATTYCVYWRKTTTTQS